ncbi:NAD(P)H-binding protein [Leifsonia sp. fls2-241-R2A-40a]|uniref:NAD(P)-dependent oxidoreductase n=1 Tax=Leifsonia sp. fls2-241-R2A-40a TaxID=3040290 RepID=UPI002550FE8A|nr:NAD(P)H-binding protein [Leifsonia sp. fls2-241-R2A-40a]
MANISIIGGTGFTGSHIAAEAASRGHHVTSLSRSEPSEPVDGVTYLTGSADEPEQAIDGADVIVATVSPRGDSAGTLGRRYGRLAELAAASGARLVVIGGFSSLRPAPDAPRFAEGDDIPPQFADEARELNAVLGDLIDNAPEGLDWLFVSPAGTYGAYAPQQDRRGTYRVGEDVALFDDEGVSIIGGEDFAQAVIDEIETPTRSRSQIHFVY